MQSVEDIKKIIAESCDASAGKFTWLLIQNILICDIQDEVENYTALGKLTFGSDFKRITNKKDFLTKSGRVQLKHFWDKKLFSEFR